MQRRRDLRERLAVFQRRHAWIGGRRRRPPTITATCSAGRPGGDCNPAARKSDSNSLLRKLFRGANKSRPV